MSRYLIFVKPRFDVYKDVSWQIRAILAEHTPIVEPLSLDEAYLDVTEKSSRHRIRSGDCRADQGEDPPVGSPATAGGTSPATGR